MDAPPPRRVLVATDLSPRAGRAVQRAAQLAARHGSRLTALHAVPQGIEADLVGFARSELRAHVERHAPHVTVETVVRSGRPASVITVEARECAADLLVVGAHGAHWLADMLTGRTAEALVRRSHVPVLVVQHPPDRDYRTVLLPVEPSDISFTAAQEGIALTPGAEHLVVHVSTVPGEHLMQMRGVDDASLAELRRVSTERVRPGIEEAAAGLTPPPARVLVVPGRPESRIVELASEYEADLTVVGTGTHSRFGYALVGSVAQYVLRRAPSDVLVVRGTGE
ncbi:universal stress protein [Streptomyces sp. ACA25]|uniref:universal stress protein n=1 Tax=Streptomyces sp. ACA25 TaxID=3022596 RepID=UPI002307BA3D|nr:universal stress protein [Streptomyces sp. ACA25]MDB1088252.1 universal stress protein [Streptomyces sp. ACA25]